MTKGNRRERQALVQGLYQKDQEYSFIEAIEILKRGASLTRFVETVEVAISTGVDPRKFSVRGMTVLPHGSGRACRIAVFASGLQAEQAKEAGAHAVGMEDLMASMEAGDLNYQVVIAVPEAMGLVGKLGKVLGPKGLMPNPKLGTVTQDVRAAIANALKGQASFRLDKAGIVHAPIGRVDFSAQALLENVIQLVEDLKKVKPSAAKGVYLKQMFVSSTMGVGVRVDMSSLRLEG